MKTLMILGASALQLPAIVKAKELGYRTIVLDYNPQAIGAPLADEFYPVSTVDVAGVVGLAKKLRPDGVLTLATDMPMRSVAAAAAALGLPGISPETALLTTDKGEMIKRFQEKDIPHPWFHIVRSKSELKALQSRLCYPCIAKPVDNSGSRGVIRVREQSELEAAYFYSRKHSVSKTIIIEECMVGPEVSVELIILKGVPHVVAITDKVTTGPPHFIELGHSQGSQLAAKIQTGIRHIASRAVKAVNIIDGAAHVEIIITSDGPKLVEMGARLGGGCLATHLVPLSTGVDMVQAVITQALGGIPSLKRRFIRGSAIRFLSPPPGRIEQVQGIAEAKESPGVVEVVLSKTEGCTVNELKSGADRIGHVIAQGENAAAAIDCCARAIALIRFKMNNRGGGAR